MLRDERTLRDGEVAVRRTWAVAEFLVIDDVGLGQVKKHGDEPTAAHTLYNLIDRRHGRASTAVSSNIALSDWGKYLGDATLTAAILDPSDPAEAIQTDGLHPPGIQTDPDPHPADWITIPPRCHRPGGPTPAPQMDQSKGAAKAEKLDPSVRAKYTELWTAAQTRDDE